MPEIILTHVTKRWDKFYAVDDLNLVIDDNAFPAGYIMLDHLSCGISALPLVYAQSRKGAPAVGQYFHDAVQIGELRFPQLQYRALSLVKLSEQTQ